MLAYVPVVFDLYRPLAPRLRWTLQCLVAFADRAGKCWPSVRKLAEVAGIGKSSVSRHLAALARAGILTRRRKPGGCYSYSIDSRFLPAQRGVSQPRPAAVPRARTEENPIKKPGPDQHVRNPYTFHDDSSRWEARLRAWRKSGGKFWPPFAGPRPDEPGCGAPRDMIDAAIAGVITLPASTPR